MLVTTSSMIESGWIFWRCASKVATIRCRSAGLGNCPHILERQVVAAGEKRGHAPCQA